MNAQPQLGMCDFDATYARVYPEKRHYSETYWGVLYGLACSLPARRIMEIGVDQGVSTRAFLAALHRVAPGDGRLWSVDPRSECGESGQPNRDHIARIGLAHLWTFLPGLSQYAEPVPDLDLLYVDGDHSYGAVSADMERHGMMVRDGGLVVLDDYHVNFPGKVQWVNERWDRLDPLVIGPLVIVRVRSGMARHTFRSLAR